MHGTRKHDPRSIAMARDGLVVELGNPKGFYGRGLYFAEKGCYAHHYAHWSDGTPSGPRQLLIARVLCGRQRRFASGELCRGLKWPHLRRERFDSVVGGPHSPHAAGRGRDDSLVHVVYQSTQCLPEFIVHYEPRRDVAVALPQCPTCYDWRNHVGRTAAIRRLYGALKRAVGATRDLGLYRQLLREQIMEAVTEAEHCIIRSARLHPATRRAPSLARPLRHEVCRVPCFWSSLGQRAASCSSPACLPFIAATVPAASINCPWSRGGSLL